MFIGGLADVKKPKLLFIEIKGLVAGIEKEEMP
jgi:hypothetical protein